MKKPYLFILFFAVILLSSCQPVLRMVSGIKKPKYESEADMKAYLQASGIYPEHSFTLDSLDWNKVFYAKDRTFPDLLLFDTAGNRIPDKGMCIPYSQNFVDALISTHNRNFIKTNNYPTFHDFEEIFRDYSGQKVTVRNNNHYKAIIIWAVFLGRRKGLKKLKKVIYYVQHSKYPITLYFLNTDLQSYWRKDTLNKVNN